MAWEERAKQDESWIANNFVQRLRVFDIEVFDPLIFEAEKLPASWNEAVIQPEVWN